MDGLARAPHDEDAGARGELELLRAAVEGGLDGMVVVSSGGVMISSNEKFQQMWPIPPEVVASGNDEAALASVLDKLLDPDAFLARVHELYTQASGSARDELQLRDGRVFDRFGTALRDGIGRYIGWAWYFRDVTVERAAAVDAERLGALVLVAQALAAARSAVDVLTVVDGHGGSVLGARGAVLALFEPGAARVRVLATTYFDEDLRADVAELPLDFPLPLVRAAVTGEGVFLSDREESVRCFPEAEEIFDRARTQGQAAVPLLSQGRTIGALGVAFADPHPFRAADRAVLHALAALTAQALDRLRAEQAEREATQEIRRLSETLQRSLLTALPQVDHLHIAARYLPAARDAEVGGDWYDAFPTADGTMSLVVGDVAGHDSTAAAAMAQVRNVLRGVAQTLRASPAEVLSALDSALARLEMTTLATAVLCQAWPDAAEPDAAEPDAAEPDGGEPDGGEADGGDAGQRTVRLRWSNAGHPPPLLVRGDGRAHFLGDRAEMLLGVRPEGPRTEAEARLAPGDSLLLYTDGLVEKRTQPIDVGLDRLRRAASAAHGLPAEAMCDALLGALVDTTEDDVVLLVARAV